MSTSIRIILGLLLAFVSIGALGGGSFMMLGSIIPDLDLLRMPLSLLDPIPFLNSWFIPGLLLFCLNGVGSGYAAWICWIKGSTAAGKAGLLMGSVLFIWIMGQVMVIGYVSILQPIFGIIGLVEIILAISLLKLSKGKKYSSINSG